MPIKIVHITICVKEILTFLDKMNDLNFIRGKYFNHKILVCKKLNLNKVNFFKSSKMNIIGKKERKSN